VAKPDEVSAESGERIQGEVSKLFCLANRQAKWHRPPVCLSDLGPACVRLDFQLPTLNHLLPVGTLYYSDNLDILRRCLKDETIDLVCPGPL
jgi:hypothetical protein